MKAHGLSHPFEQKPAKIIIPPEDMLLHEPWRSNLIWGMDWDVDHCERQVHVFASAA